MPVPDISGLPPFADFNDVTTKLNDLVQRLRQLLLNLDTLNIRELNAQKLVAGSITGDKIEANSINAGHIQANAVTADKIDVNELSAISANLGHIVAGLIESVEIYGSYIATRNGGFPRAELSSDQNLFGAFKDANNHITIEPDYGGSPSVRFTQNGQFKGRINLLLGYLELFSNGPLNIQSTGIMFLDAPVIQLSDWNKLYSARLGRNLGEELTEIFLRLEQLEGG
jgi:hypothetical protein